MPSISRPSSFGSDFSEDQEDSIAVGFTDDKICGEGASCRVYRMYLNGLRVAVKRLRAEYRTNPAYVASYRKEFHIGQQLKHDALPVYRELRDDTDEVYIVMDFIDGITVSDFIESEEGKEHFSSAENVSRFFTELINAIGYLHRRGVIHCDLKPANIMLRHTDRGVMLIDLDKCYCDTLNRTHGGTPHLSDPLSKEERPTVQKDYVAIGNLLNYIEERANKFPKGYLRRLRKECANANASDESLRKALKSRSHLGTWIATLSGVVIVTGLTIYFLRPVNLSESDNESENELATEIPDTVKSDESMPGKIPGLVPDVATGESTIHREEREKQRESEERKNVSGKEANISAPENLITSTEYDAAMADFIKEAQEAIRELETQSPSDDRVMDIMEKVSKSYSSKYYELIQRYKSKYPELSGIDLEYRIATTAEKSEAKRLCDKFMNKAMSYSNQ